VYAELGTLWSELARGLSGPDALAQQRVALGRVARIGELEHEGIIGLERWLAA
jgi:hypothetical protein